MGWRTALMHLSYRAIMPYGLNEQSCGKNVSSRGSRLRSPTTIRGSRDMRVEALLHLGEMLPHCLFIQ